MIIFSQGPTTHSRLANSLVWMSKVQSLLDYLGRACCFPWAIENFGNYLDNNSFWMVKNDAYNLYQAHTKRQLSASNVSSLARTIEHKHERKNGLNAFDWTRLITYSDEFQCLYLSGNIDITSIEIINLINEHELVIIHEPFNLSYRNPELSKVVLDKITPKEELFAEQSKFINSLSLGKKSIGLHIRRGDYERWSGGKYFYDDDFWLNKVKEFVSLDCAVYIFTNEINSPFHYKLKTLGAHVGNESFEIDFVRMMLMNEIFGPPSTFSVMAVDIAKSCFSLDAKFHCLPGKI